ncbi:LysR family transcriptional regulator [Pseudomonas corrugata]|nr:LysR family transcriptional regulator [Pseudomonas corrugata]MDU9022794.1 LysR family transcriptional regulator [Pseudomonas corrugata]
MTRAAELLNISQPAISSTIANLEHETGLKLDGHCSHPCKSACLGWSSW